MFFVVKPNFVYKKESLLKLKLFKIDLSKADNLLSAENMNIEFVASAYWKFDKEGSDLKVRFNAYVSKMMGKNIKFWISSPEILR